MAKVEKGDVKTPEQLQQELIEAQSELLSLRPEEKPKHKPYTREEVKELAAKGHHIGAPNQKLSEGHDEEDLQSWDLCMVEMHLKDIGKLPEIGKEWSVPDFLILLKVDKKGMKASDKTFQWKNKQMDYRYPATEHRYMLHLPSGKLESGKRYECHYWVEEIRDAGGVQKLPRLLVKEFPVVTGAPTDPTKWGRG